MSWLLEVLGRGLLGELHDALGDHLPAVDDDALSDIAARAADSPTSRDLALRLATLHLRGGRLTAARTEFERALHLPGSTRTAHVGLACVADGVGRLDDAVRHLTQARAEDPSDPAIAFAVAYCFERRGDFAAAEASYALAAELHPGLVNARERIAAIAVREQRWDDAIAQYEALLERLPEDLRLLLILAGLNLQAGDVYAAGELYQRALLVEPQADAADDAADDADDAGRYREALAALERLVEQFPGVPDFHVQLGDSYAKIGDHVAAASAFEAALDLHPNFLEAAIKLGAQQSQLGLLDDAAQTFARALELNDNLVTAFVGLGVAQADNDELDSAHATFDLAVSLEPNSTLLFWESTRLELQHARRQMREQVEAPPAELLLEALQRCEQALYQHPNYADLHYRYGLLLNQIGEQERAESAFCNAVSINPGYSKAQMRLGLCLKARGDLEDSEAALRRALTLEPAQAELHYELGLLFAQRARFDLAVEHFEHASDGKGRDISFRANMALALQNMGLVDRAHATWRAVAELARDMPPAPTRESILRGLGHAE